MKFWKTTHVTLVFNKNKRTTIYKSFFLKGYTCLFLLFYLFFFFHQMILVCYPEASVRDLEESRNRAYLCASSAGKRV